MNTYGLSFVSEEKRDRVHNLFKVHMKLLHLAGILPVSIIVTCQWNAHCYNIFSAIFLTWCVPPLIALLSSIHENWGDISVVTGMVLQVSFVVNYTATYIYLILNRKQLQSIISVSETAFARHLKYLNLKKNGHIRRSNGWRVPSE
jgi:uncharacterized membrane protein